MKPPEGLKMRIVGRNDDSVIVDVAASEITHASPPIGSGVMPCCERTPFEVPRWHRLASDAALVTCAHNGSHGTPERRP